MGTFVTIQIASAETSDTAVDTLDAREQALDRAFEWFHRVEGICSRFDAGSELMQLSTQIGVAVPASTMLLEAVRFALSVAETTGGAFDPTVGLNMERRGFDREHRTGARIHTAVAAERDVSFRDVVVDDGRRTITLKRPLVLDLGAVAKGLAVDMAARELGPHQNYAINAGGDLYLGGEAAAGRAWTVGIRHPRKTDELLGAVHVRDCAVCTSGDYERFSPADGGPHIVDPRTLEPVHTVASVTVVGPSAMLADALGTAAFVLGADAGLELLEQHGVEGLMVSPLLERRATPGMHIDYDFEHASASSSRAATILSDA